MKTKLTLSPVAPDIRPRIKEAVALAFQTCKPGSPELQASVVDNVCLELAMQEFRNREQNVGITLQMVLPTGSYQLEVCDHQLRLRQDHRLIAEVPQDKTTVSRAIRIVLDIIERQLS